MAGFAEPTVVVTQPTAVGAWPMINRSHPLADALRSLWSQCPCASSSNGLPCGWLYLESITAFMR